LCPFGKGDRSLCLSRVIEGQKIPARFESRVKNLIQEATDHCGGELSPTHLASEIVASSETERWAVGNPMELKPIPHRHRHQAMNATQKPHTSPDKTLQEKDHEYEASKV